MKHDTCMWCSGVPCLDLVYFLCPAIWITMICHQYIFCCLPPWFVFTTMTVVPPMNGVFQNFPTPKALVRKPDLAADAEIYSLTWSPRDWRCLREEARLFVWLVGSDMGKGPGKLRLVEFDAKLSLRLPKLSLCTISSEWRWRFGAWLVFFKYGYGFRCACSDVLFFCCCLHCCGFQLHWFLLLMSLLPHFEPCVWRWFALSIRLWGRLLKEFIPTRCQDEDVLWILFWILNTVFLGSTPIDSFFDGKRAPIRVNLTTSSGKQGVGFTQKFVFEKKRSDTTTV